MCGIVGIYNYRDAKPCDERILSRMNNVLLHRGPDGAGLFRDGAVGFGHRRLAIVELSEAGKQPMSSSCGRYVITYNGEIYNHSDYRPKLQNHGYRFRGHADTETLVNLFSLEGSRCFQGLAGIFCFAIWDKREHELHLVRDPLGVKQVYYWDNGSSLVFASEIKAILAHDDYRASPNYSAIGDFFHFHTPVDDRTFFNNIRVVRPGEHLRVNSNGIVSHSSYLRPENYSAITSTVTDASAQLEETLKKVVTSQLMSDVPVGCFLSGGIDSTLVAKYSGDHLKGALKTFGCFYRGQAAIDEEPYAREVATTFGLKLEAVHPTTEDFSECFERALWHQDEPKIGAAMISMWKVAALAANHVKVCLGGQAGDEIFGGYARYAAVSPARVLWRELVRRIQKETNGPAATVQKSIRRGNNARRLFNAMHPFHDWRKTYFSILSQFHQTELRKLAPNTPEIYAKDRAFSIFCTGINNCESRDPIDRAMYWDRKVYLTGLFAQDDRLSMAHSLETRVPLADPRLVALAVRIPNRWKLNGMSSKWILKNAIRHHVPANVLNRQKAGFETPLKPWLLGPGREMVSELLVGKRARERGLMDPGFCQGLLKSEIDPGRENLIWKIINIEQWFRLYIDRQQAWLRP